MRADLIPPVEDPHGVPVIAGMATMPSRCASFAVAFRSIIRQVDCLYLYLDGHDEVPHPARDHPRVVPIFSRAEPGHHSNGKFLGLTQAPRDAIYVTVDDDILYGRFYVKSLLAGLQRNGKAVVGLHGNILAQPLESYCTGWKVVHFKGPLAADRIVDVLGSGTAMFRVADLRFDVRRWPHRNMDDLGLAIEAGRRGLPMVSIARGPRTAFSLAEGQDDSLYTALLEDDTRETALARELLAIRAIRQCPTSSARRALPPPLMPPGP